MAWATESCRVAGDLLSLLGNREADSVAASRLDADEQRLQDCRAARVLRGRHPCAEG